LKKPHLYAIAHHEHGSALNAKRTPINNSEAIHKWWVGQLPQRDEAQVLAKLARIKEDGVWIACDCTGNPADPPLFAIPYLKNKDSKGSGGRIYMRRMAERGAHALDKQRQHRTRNAEQLKEPAYCLTSDGC
jgi:hypothetical protein